MIRVYTVTETNDLRTSEADSLGDLERLGKVVDWLWIDVMEPSAKEFEVVAGLLKETTIVADITKQRIVARPERVGDFLLFSIPHAVYEDGLKFFPIYVFVKGDRLLTIRNGYSSRFVQNALETFKDCVGKICEGSVNSSFVLSRLFHEVSDENLDVVMELRESIDTLEEKALAQPANKNISSSVFSIKRELSALEKVLWSQRALMLSVREGVIPMIETPEEIGVTLDHPINNISRELSLLESHNNALDSILNLQDLGMIHRVEKRLIYLTLIALVVSIFLFLLEILKF